MEINGNQYISHFSAAFLWEIPKLESVLTQEYVKKYKNDRVTDVTVNDLKFKSRRKSLNSHVCKLSFPRNAVTKVGKDFVASPEYVFLQLANELDFHRLILLGLQLCSHPPWRKSQALTTKRKIEIFLNNTPMHRGNRKAKQALQYVKNGSHSIMESILFMFLTLPSVYGGYGLKGAMFNYEIPLDNEAKAHLDKQRCFVDIFYPDSDLGIEYNSKEFHSSPLKQGQDALRSSILEYKGIDMMQVTSTQLYDRKACKVFAHNVASHLGKRIRNSSKKFDISHKKLRNLLPFDPR